VVVVLAWFLWVRSFCARPLKSNDTQLVSQPHPHSPHPSAPTAVTGDGPPRLTAPRPNLRSGPPVRPHAAHPTHPSRHPWSPRRHFRRRNSATTDHLHAATDALRHHSPSPRHSGRCPGQRAGARIPTPPWVWPYPDRSIAAWPGGPERTADNRLEHWLSGPAACSRPGGVLRNRPEGDAAPGDPLSSPTCRAFYSSGAGNRDKSGRWRGRAQRHVAFGG